MDTVLTDQLEQLADQLEGEFPFPDEHGSFDDHYNTHEDCPHFINIEFLRDTASKIKQAVVVIPDDDPYSTAIRTTVLAIRQGLVGEGEMNDHEHAILLEIASTIRRLDEHSGM